MEHTPISPEPSPGAPDRTLRCRQLLAEYRLPIVSLRLTVPYRPQAAPALDRTFQEGLERLSCALTAAGLRVQAREQLLSPAGREALWAVSGDGQAVAKLCMELEDEDALAQLLRLDVLDPAQEEFRQEKPPERSRKCPVCSGVLRECALRRAHTVKELQGTADAIAASYFARRDCQALGALAAKALLYEVCTTPKPGLVDRNNTGSHRDMDLFTFLDSTAALLPYFQQAARIGQKTAQLPPHETFLRRAGAAGELAMFRATAGINTHKGAVFTLGTVCAAAGRLWTPAGFPAAAEDILSLCGQMSAQAMEQDFAAMAQGEGRTVGQRLYLTYGLEGIRGELRRGLPAVSQIGLPLLRARLRAGATLEQAGREVLLHLMAQVTDTNLIARGGLGGQQWAMAQAQALIRMEAVSQEAMEAFDREMIERNLSPGGCADLLAITFFLHFLEKGAPYS